MLRLLTQHARPGMKLALPIHHPRVPDCVLLREGMELDAFSIPHLRDMGIPEVWIEYPGLEHLVKFVDPQLHSEMRELVVRIGLCLDQALLSPVDMDFYPCKRALISIIRRMAESPQTALWTSEIAGTDTPFSRHCGNVAALSLMMGMKLDFYLVSERPRLAAGRAKDLTSLGIGALFHDIGVLRLPKETVDQYNIARDTSDPMWRKHTSLGYEMVRGTLDPSASTVVLHHHQAFDGSGWPHRQPLKGGTEPLAGHDIHVLARICAAADLCDRLRNPAHTPHSDSLTHDSVPRVKVLHTLLQPEYARLLDPVVRAALFSIMPPYTPGSLVTLSDGTDAVVVDWNPSNPCRPIVEFADTEHAVIKPKRHKGKPRRVDLREAKDLMIAAIDGVDIRQWHFEPENEVDFDINAMARQMSNRAFADLSAEAAKGLVLDDATLEEEERLKKDAA